MELLFPWALAGLVLVPAIFLWGLLAPRGRPLVVGSLMLWRRVLGGGAAGRPSAKVRLRDPLLWLDAAAVLLVVLACARPALRTEEPSQHAVLLVIDRTASMAIDAGDGPRWRRAREMTDQLLRRAGNMALRLVEVPLEDGAIGGCDDMYPGEEAWWTPVPSALDVWPFAVAQAAAYRHIPVIVVTDIAPAESLPANVFVLATGGQSRNVGLTRAASRVEAGGPWLLVAARADAAAPGRCAVTAGGATFLEEKPAFVSPGRTAEAVLPMRGSQPPQVAVELRDAAGQPVADGFRWDNAAYLALEPAAGVRVLLVGQAEAALRRALAAREDVEVVEAGAEAAAVPEGTDLVVAYAVLPPADWAGPTALVLPPQAVGPVRPGDGQAPAEWRVVAGHPLAAALYLEPPRLAPVRLYGLDASAQLLLGTPDVPLVVTWETEAGGGFLGPGKVRHMAVLLSFDDQATDWPRRAGFPVFWSRAVEWLAPGETRRAQYKSYRPFEPMPGGGLAAAAPGFHRDAAGRTYGVSFIGTDEGFQAGPGRDDSAAALEAIRRAMEARRRAAHHDLWPWLAAAALTVVAARAWVAR
ncbi:MAG: hypothetical protein FJ288_05000 [Planctomycetes bacterium]|nr:hypothetical protein [Planctomycetota bacterium]